jgi:3-oxoacyl-[acyl-carrier-protein] synthase-3
MAVLKTTHARIAGVTCSFPAQEITTATTAERLGADAKRVLTMTGIESRRVAPPHLCASDLCADAAERLLASLKWEKESVSGLIFLSQTPDYILPATACLLQEKLGLSKSCVCFDVNMGCSGYVYGLMTAASLLETGLGRVLLLVGDTINRISSEEDKSVAFLFGDAGSATALERGKEHATFVVGTDGGGAKHLIIRAGQCRQRATPELCVRTQAEPGNVRSPQELYMNGSEVLAFALREVPQLFEQLQKESGVSKDGFDAVVLHQANQFMLDGLARKMGIAKESVPSSVRLFGNTSCASIPVTMLCCLRDKLQSSRLKIAMLGFGVGWSWGGCSMDVGPIEVPEPAFL